MKLFKTPRIIRKYFFRRTWGFSMHTNEVFLTFDDGPHPDITPFVLDELNKHQITACFFCVGDNVRKYPELFDRIRNEGHQVGNHTMFHNNAIKTKEKVYFESIHTAQELIQSTYFRPPYGRLQPSRSRRIAKEYKIIMWSWLSYDFDLSISIKDILQNAEKNIQRGDILVLHDNPKIKERQKELLPQLIQLIKDKNLIFGRLR